MSAETELKKIRKDIKKLFVFYGIMESAVVVLLIIVVAYLFWMM